MIGSVLGHEVMEDFFMFKFSLAAVISAIGLSACASSAGFQEGTMTQRDSQLHDATLKLKLKDYSSAQFLGAPRVAETPKGFRMICGAVNAKNSFGGYIGYQDYSIAYMPNNPSYPPLFYLGGPASIDCRGAGIAASIPS